MIFCNKKLIGGPTDFIQWAETSYNYELFRPMSLYQTLAEQQYADHMNKQGVRNTSTTTIYLPLILAYSVVILIYSFSCHTV